MIESGRQLRREAAGRLPALRNGTRDPEQRFPRPKSTQDVVGRANDAYWTLTRALEFDPPALAALADIRDATNHLIDLLNQEANGLP